MRWKRIAGIAAILIIVIVVAVYVILATYDYNKLKPLIVRTVKEATGRELTLAGDINLGIGFSPALVVESVSLQNASWGSRPELAKIERLEIQVALLPLIKKSIQIKRLVLVEPDILIETDRSGKLNLEVEIEKGMKSEESEGKEWTKLSRVSLMQVRMENGRFAYREGKSGKSYVLRGQNVEGTAEDLNGPIQLNFKGAYNDISIESVGTVGPLKALTDPNLDWPLKLSVKIAGATVTVDGRITDVMSAKGMALDVNLEGQSFPEIAGLVGMSDVVDVGPFKIGLKLSDPAQRTFKISDLEVAFGGSDLGGSAEISLAHSRPKITAKVSSENLDLRPLFSTSDSKGESKETPGQPIKSGDKVFPDDPLPVDLLNHADARVEFQAENIRLPNLAVNDLKVQMVLNGGHLAVKPLKAAVGGGSLEARFDLHAQGKNSKFAATLRVSQLDLARMVKKLGLEGTLEGEVGTQLNLESHGGSVAALMAGLNGKTSLVMGKGRIYNTYIHRLGRIFSPTLPQILNPFLEATEYTQTNCIVSGFVIEDGVASSTTLVFDTEDITVLSDGTANLDTEELDFSLGPVPKEGARKKKIKRTFSLSELAKPFRLSGTFTNPSIELDTRRTARTIGKGAGAALIGPGALVAVLFTSKTGEKDPCPAAIEAVEEWFKSSEDEKRVAP